MMQRDEVTQSGKINQRFEKGTIESSSHSLEIQNFSLGSDYLIFNKLTTGNHSNIYYGINKDTKQQHAFKLYNFKELQVVKGFRTKQLIKRIVREELQIKEKCRSINVLKCCEVFQSRDYKVLVSQYCQGSLRREIRERKEKRISEIKAIAIIKQIITGLKCLHRDAEILHVNLYPQHILVKNGIYKLTDFGLPDLLEEGNQDKAVRMAPEILRREAYDAKAQVWSLGLLFHEILLGYLPSLVQDRKIIQLTKESDQTIFKAGLRLSEPVSQFLQGCLCRSPKKRLNWFQMEEHSMFNMLGSKSMPQQKKHMAKSQKPDKNAFVMSMILPLGYNDDNGVVDSEEENRPYNLGVFLDEKRSWEANKKYYQRQLERQYVKSGQHFQIKKLEETAVPFLKKQINKDEETFYIQTKEFYLQCLKVEFVMRNILDNLPKDRKEDRSLVQLENLIVGSCFAIVSRLNSKKTKGKGKKYEGIVGECLIRATTKLYQEVLAKWNQSCEMLSKIESKVLSSFFDKFKSLMNKQQQKEKKKFLDGIQRIDFGSAEKVKFTKKYYKSNQQSIEKQGEKKVDAKILKKTWQYLQKYDKIWQLSVREGIEEKYSSLKTYIDEQILRQYSSMDEK